MPHRSNITFRGLLQLTLTVILLLSAAVSFAQITTGNLAGTVTTRDDAAALPGVTVEAVHVPTGTRYQAVTNESGRFNMPNVRVGGPYTVSANLEGFRTAERTGVQVGLGSTTEVSLGLALSGVSEAITVTATAPVIDTTRAGASTEVSTEQIDSLPTVSRSLQDFARLNPYFGVDPTDASSTRLTVAGKNNRYNNIQIDGAVNNDLFGLSDTGTPGGQTDAQPISLDAIEQLQLVVSPFDVRQGGFTGGGINAVTRSGTNNIDGSLFYSQRNEDLVGDGPFDIPISTYSQDQYGGRVGGPIMRDRLFFFLSGEVNRREEPTGVSADNTTGTVFNAPADAQRLREFLTTRFQHDPGPLGDFPGETNSDLAFLRFDWNIASNNQLVLRHNYVDATRDVISGRSRSSFRFPSAIYTIADETNSSVAQLNSVFGANAFNEARIGFQTIRDQRATPVTFPTVEIGGTGPRRGALHIGTERFSGANNLAQDILEITDDLTLIRGNHNITIGTHNEFFEFSNLFLSEFYGYYYFATLDDFEAGRAREYRISFANGADPRRPTQFEVGQYGLYVSDQWRVSDRLTLTLGIRGDMPSFGDAPSVNPVVQTALGFNTGETPNDDIVFSPRIGFNWDPVGNNRQQLRGGIGVFAGRTPYVWISNAYGNTGVETTALSCFAPRCTPPVFNPDPLAQPRNVGAGGTLSVDLVDPDFSFPRVLRATLGYDQELFWNIRGTAEVVHSQTQEDVFYYNVNRVQTGVSPLDGRPTYGRVASNIGDAVLLSNTDEGEETIATLQFHRNFGSRWTASATYAFQDTSSAFDATSSRAISNFQFRPTPGDIFAQDTSRSTFEIEDRFTGSLSYNFPTGPLSHTVGFFYNAQSGRPYSLLMGGDPNRDGMFSNDLLYVPAGDVILCPTNARTPTATSPCGANVSPIDAARFTSFLDAAGVTERGEILDRNALNEPWSRQLDFHYELGLPVRDFGAELTLDVQNVLNMIDSEYGVVEFVNFQTYTPVRFQGIDAASGNPIYREEFNGALLPGRQFRTADTRSRWQARVGVRLNF